MLHPLDTLPEKWPRGTQIAALCYKPRFLTKSLQILLITSRGSGRWILPKGWPIKGHSASETAAIEAFEEAGVIGEADPGHLGKFAYTSKKNRSAKKGTAAYVIPIRVKAMQRDFPEKGQRQLRWCDLQKAIENVREPELKTILKTFGGLYTASP